MQRSAQEPFPEKLSYVLKTVDIIFWYVVHQFNIWSRSHVEAQAITILFDGTVFKCYAQ
jgi:hypothetical protein